MNNSSFFWVIIIIALIAAIGAVAFWGDISKWYSGVTDKGVFCTQDAKLCPDGSYVGRVSPNCQFATCPSESLKNGETGLEAGIGKGANSLGVKITPLEVLEDSRCPLDVVCIQAGTVRVRARIENESGSVIEIFKLQSPVITEMATIEMVKVTPESRSQRVITPLDYRFLFKVSVGTIIHGGKG